MLLGKIGNKKAHPVGTPEQILTAGSHEPISLSSHALARVNGNVGLQ